LKGAYLLVLQMVKFENSDFAFEKIWIALTKNVELIWAKFKRKYFHLTKA